IHLEEDTGTSKHPEGRVDVDYSLLDYNRAGVPLMELVTDPDIETAQEAKEFCQKYQLILRTLGVADADMEKGQMRCEANISLRELKTKNEKLKTKLGTKVEVKNLNSFKAVERAVEYEIERQAEVLEAGEKVVQETRGWDDKNGQTYTMRVKETSADYRYFPEPDLPPVEVTNKEKAEIRKQLPELPEEKSKRYKNMGFAEVIQETIPLNTEWAKAFDLGEPEKLTLNQRKIYGNFYVGIGLKLLNIGKIKADRINPKNIARLSVLIDENKISSNIAKEEKLFIEAITSDKDIAEIIKAKGLTQISDSGKLEAIIEKIIKDNPDAVAKIKSGQTGVMGFLVGQIMRETKGQANPKIVNEILRKKISLNK
ncbi:MAG: Asp-tRNA(Asn)/Glu-tRNA(Gln) amidotransferase subunit GatB, partial [Patescibacteria group bacterium]|nr:Asp-tRNA(Asn)/Glu-tRNA(Gln) amidotransferase subunit GatB [Patescibacteria group bacterium]